MTVLFYRHVRVMPIPARSAPPERDSAPKAAASHLACLVPSRMPAQSRRSHARRPARASGVTRKRCLYTQPDKQPQPGCKRPSGRQAPHQPTCRCLPQIPGNPSFPPPNTWQPELKFTSLV